MKIEVKDNQIILKEVYNSISFETEEGNILYICMRDNGFEVKLNNESWCMIKPETNTLISSISKINTNTKEGKYLMAALAKLTTESQIDKTPDEVLEQCNQLQEKMYDTKTNS